MNVTRGTQQPRQTRPPSVTPRGNNAPSRQALSNVTRGTQQPRQTRPPSVNPGATTPPPGRLYRHEGCMMYVHVYWYLPVCHSVNVCVWGGISSPCQGEVILLSIGWKVGHVVVILWWPCWCSVVYYPPSPLTRTRPLPPHTRALPLGSCHSRVIRCTYCMLPIVWTPASPLRPPPSHRSLFMWWRPVVRGSLPLLARSTTDATSGKWKVHKHDR